VAVIVKIYPVKSGLGRKSVGQMCSLFETLLRPPSKDTYGYGTTDSVTGDRIALVAKLQIGFHNAEARHHIFKSFAGGGTSFCDERSLGFG